MNLFAILLIAIGLAMDAFAVSIACGVSIKKIKIGHVLSIAGAFGLFQGGMPLIGWAAGRGFRGVIERFDHWLAFALLVVIGTKMIYESFALDEEDGRGNMALAAGGLLVLAVATSIDALAVGLTFACLQVEIVTPALIIGLVTLLLSMVGVVIGDRIGHLFEGKIELVGGLILIGIGTKILFDHLGLFGFSL
jgi:putative Mn2+ efflux pump MntP